MSDRLNGREHWRSFEQMAGSESAMKHIEQEFPGYDPNEIVSMPRRRFLKLAAASMAAAGVTATGCRRWPKEHLVPSTAGLRDQLPGVPEFYATAVERAGVADSLLVTSYDGRPLKIEGNPLHPLFTTWRKADGTPVAAASNPYAQASILELYDPARGRRVMANSNAQEPQISTWDAFLAEFESTVGNTDGGNLAILSEASSGVSMEAARQAFAKRFPGATWVEYEPLCSDEEHEAGRAAFGAPTRAVYDLAKAKTIVSLDGDLFGNHPNRIRHANDWSARRRSVDSDKTMNRMYVAESTFTITGASADHRLPLRPSQLAGVALGLAAAVGVSGVAAPNDLTDAQKQWIAAAAADLNAGEGVVTVGTHAAPPVQALAHQMNVAIGANGNAVRFVALPEKSGQIAEFRKLCDRISGSQIRALIILGGNPVYDAPADLNFKSKLASVPLTAHLALYPDETSRSCKWHLPRSHYLEAWGDARAWDGSVLIQQPLIMPLYDSRSPLELTAIFAKHETTDGLQIVRTAIGDAFASAKDDAGWTTAVHDGFVKESAFADAKTGTLGAISAFSGTTNAAFELRFVPSSTFDGRHANNGWLQELPDPITKIVWDNAALMNKSDADALDVSNGDLITIKTGQHSLDIPVYVLWGQPKGVITLPLGYGRTAAGPVGGDEFANDKTDPVGYDVYTVRMTGQLHTVLGGVEVTKGDGHREIVSLQDYQQLDWAGMKGYVDRVGVKGDSGRMVRETSMENYLASPNFVDHVGHRFPLLQLWDAPYPSLETKREIAAKDPKAPQAFNVPHAWGMAIDMSTCIGCNACVTACQSENNIPIVGKAMTKMGRAMHWIRIDRYFKAALTPDRKPVNDDYENVDVTYQPVMCVHCENAPCEQVCPVAATVHDTEGLNTMVYNRCIGTRYCSNNCPYKVRRFNYMDWHSRNPRKDAGLELIASAWLGIPDQQQQETIAQVKRMVFNPEVTVRMRGVMEKCTYCTQRIKAATIKRKNDWTKGLIPQGEKANGQPAYTVDDFEVITACQQACPTQALTFGNLMDRDSLARKRQELPRAYALLEDLNTRPRGKHLAKIRNPNQSLVPSAAPGDASHDSSHHA